MFSGADVYSYGEDDMVLDPLLAEHLSHFGKALIQDRVLKNCFPYKIYNYLPLTVPYSLLQSWTLELGVLRDLKLLSF